MLSWDGLKIVDISNKKNPKILGNFDKNIVKTSDCLFVENNNIYIADWSEGLKIIDTRDPKNPNIISKLIIPFDINDFPYDLNSINIQDKYAYLTCQWNPTGNFFIIDISDDENPYFLSMIKLQHVALGCFLKDNYAYEIYGTFDIEERTYRSELFKSTGVNIIDISDKNNPSIIKSIETQDIPTSVYVKYNYLFVSYATESDLEDIYNSSFQIWDITDKSNPKSLFKIDIDGMLSDIFLQDNYGFIASSEYGLLILKIFD